MASTRAKEKRKKVNTNWARTSHTVRTLSLRLLEGLATIREISEIEDFNRTARFILVSLLPSRFCAARNPIWFMGRGQQKMSQWNYRRYFSSGVDVPRWCNGGSLFHFCCDVVVFRDHSRIAHLQIIFRATIYAWRHCNRKMKTKKKKNELIEVQRKAKRFMFDNLSVYAASLVSAKYSYFFSLFSFVIDLAQFICNCGVAAAASSSSSWRSCLASPATNHHTTDYLFINAYLNHSMFISLFHQFATVVYIVAVSIIALIK